MIVISVKCYEVLYLLLDLKSSSDEVSKLRFELCLPFSYISAMKVILL